jgi:hypothetical protein
MLNVLEAPLSMILASEAVAPARLVLIDGAEAALEGRGEVLSLVAEAVRAARLGLVAVTRSDARDQVAEALVGRPMRGTQPRLEEVQVPILTSEDGAAAAALQRALDAVLAEIKKR